MEFQEALRQPFEAEKALEAYRQWCQTDDEKALGDAIALLLPLITIVLWQEFRNRHDQEDLVSVATEWTFKDLRGKKFRRDDPAAFTAYWKISIKTTMLGYIKNRAMNTVLDFNWNCREYPYIAQPSQIEATFGEFREKLPDLIKDKVLDDIRFEGSAYKACVYILEQLLEARPVVPRVLTKKYGLKNPQFYRDYVGVLIRKALYAIRPDVEERQVSREDILKATRIELLSR